MTTMKIRFHFFLLLLLALLASACKKPAHRVEIHLARFGTEPQHRINAAASRPDVLVAFDGLGKAVVADPALANSGLGLLETLKNEPSLQASLESVLAKFSQAPAMRQLVLRLMKENP